MIKKTEHIITCPCCETELWIDKETGGILKYVKPVKDKNNFDGLMAKYKKEQSGFDTAFKKAFSRETQRKKLLEKKFKSAVKDIDEDQDS
ncbi:hypothetical protein ACFLTD_02935 [Elusimicrobiota bacterium]